MNELWERALCRRELEQRERAIETLLNQEALVRLARVKSATDRPERKRNRASLDWLRRELARVREELHG